MSVFCPHIAISSTYANLELPVGFKPDDIDILVKATPDQRAVVINTGCVVLRALLEKEGELSEDQASKKGKEECIAAEFTRWQREKKTLETEKESQLKELNETVNRLQNEIDKERETIASMSKDFERIRNAKDQLNQKLYEAQDTAQKYLEACRKAENKQYQLTVEKLSEIREAEEKVREAEEEVRKEWIKKCEDLDIRCQILTNRQTISPKKGNDNEDAFAALLDASFGTAADYSRLPKKNKSGDHVIQWERLKLMFENKIYKDTVPTKEVDKALRDFGNNLKCHVLIFVSEITDIVNHRRAGDLDITYTLNGRPVIWIGKFGLIENKISYLLRLGVVIRQLVCLTMLAKQLKKEIEGNEKIIKDFRDYSYFHYNGLNKLDNAHKEYEKARNAAWESLKNQMKAHSFREEDDVTEIKEAESDAAQKIRRQTVKNKQPRNSKSPSPSTGLNYAKTSSEGTSEHQAGQEATD